MKLIMLLRTTFVVLLLLGGKFALGNALLSSQPLDNVSGTVTNEEGNSLADVSIVVKGTSIGTRTDNNGRYIIRANKGQTLVFSFIGFVSSEVVYNNQSEINVSLKADLKTLDEIVTIGYGVQKKSTVVGAVSSINGESILKQNVPEVANALAGLLPGITTIQSTSVPGGFGDRDDATKIYIRGRSTWNSAQPLILVDGVERGIDDVDPNEIADISILKDASATAVFGVRGANGVILITTKRGNDGKAKLNLDAQQSISTISKQPGVLGSYDGNSMKNEAIINELGPSPSSWSLFLPEQILNYYRTQEYPELFPDVNWLDEFTKDFSTSNTVNFNMRGGTKFVKYFGSLSYLRQGGIIKTHDYGQGYNPTYNYDRFNFRSNLDFTVTKTTKVSVNLSGMYGVQNTPNGGNVVFANFWKSLYGHPPDLYPIQYSDGVWADNLAFTQYMNGLVAVNYNGVLRQNRTRINTDLLLDQKLPFVTKGLSLKGRISFDNYFPTTGPNITDVGALTKYIPPTVVDLPREEWDQYTIYNIPGDLSPNGYEYERLPYNYIDEFSIVNGQVRTVDYQSGLNYERTVGKNDISGLVLMQRRESASGAGFTSFREDWVGRVTYAYDSKYLLEGNGAYNGSEKFSRDYRFGFFPSVAFGWVLSKEKFFKDLLPFFQEFKIRYSNGLVGNDVGIARWQYVSSWNTLTSTWRFGAPKLIDAGLPITVEGAVANANIHWETSHKQNLGFDTKLLDNALAITFDIFWEHSYDMFVSATQRTSNDIFGATLPSANIGQSDTHGWELDANYTKQFTKDFMLNIRYTQTFARNKIIARDDPELKPFYQKQAGYAIGQTRNQINQPGIIQSWDDVYTGVMFEDNTQSLPGDFRLIDFNADGVVNGDDAVPMGYPVYPENTNSLLLNFQYKGFYGQALFYSAWNASLKTNYQTFNEGYTIIWPFQASTAWNPEAGRTLLATYPGLRLQTTSNKGEWNVEDASYTRLKSAELGYIFEPKMLKKIGASGFRVYLRGYNLALWSKLREDRETQDGSLAMRTLSYPLAKTFTIGFAIGL